MYIQEGANAGAGLYDQLIDLFINELPDYRHVRTPMNTFRAVELMTNGDDSTVTCHVSMIRRMADERLSVSKLDSVLPAHVIVARSDAAEKLHAIANPDGAISIEALIHEPDISGGLASFGTHEELLQYDAVRESFPHIQFINGAYMELLSMLLNGRVDYIVQYRAVAEYA